MSVNILVRLFDVLVSGRQSMILGGTMKKQFGVVLALALCGALSVGLAPRAFAAGVTYDIETNSDWANVAPGGSMTLNDGDTLNISSAVTSGTSTTINIAADANVTIKGSGVMLTGLCIAESSSDTTSHTVTIENLQIQGWSTCRTYTQYMGTIDLVGTNVFAGPSGGGSQNGITLLALTPNPASITSSTDGSLTVSNNQSNPSLSAKALDVLGTAHVTVTTSGTAQAVYVESVNIDSGASLVASATRNVAIRAANTLAVTNNGVLTVSGGGSPALTGGSITVSMGAGAVTSITSGTSQTVNFAMIPASGYQWQVSGGAYLVDPSTVTSSPAGVWVQQSTTGVVKLVPTPSVQSLAGATVDAGGPYPYTGEAQTPPVTVTLDGVTLVEGTDYTVSYSSNINVGQAVATVTGIGNYKDALTGYFTIIPRAVTLTVDPIPDQIATGSAITPAVVVRDGTRVLALGTDYTVSYGNNINPGTATVTITGVGNYAGSTGSTTFKILSPGSRAVGGGPVTTASTGGSVVPAAGNALILLSLALVALSVMVLGRRRLSTAR